MNQAHRMASQAKQQAQYAVAFNPATLPKFWRPTLSADQGLRCKIIHWDLIDRFTNGTANVDDLWDWIETGYTYMRIMQLQQEAGTEFTPEAVGAVSDQADIYESVIARYRKTMDATGTGKVGFTGPELLVARAAANVFDGLIELDRFGIADAAARWSTAQMDQIRAIAGTKAMKGAA